MLLLAVIPQPESLDLQIARISVAFASSRLLYMSFYLRLQSFYLRLQEAACTLQVICIYICIAHLHLHQQGSNFPEFGRTQFCLACGNKLAFALYVESPHVTPMQLHTSDLHPRLSSAGVEITAAPTQTPCMSGRNGYRTTCRGASRQLRGPIHRRRGRYGP